MKYLTLSTCLLLASGGLIAPAMAQTPFQCGSDIMRQRAIAQHPEVLTTEAELERFTDDFAEAHAGERDDTVFVIPVVFHILHNNGPENISDEQIHDAMRILNEDFRKLNSDTTIIVPGFQAIAADAHIEFRLAKLDQFGFCTNGIVRERTVKTYQGNDGAKLGQWPRARYLNIWTCAQMENGVAGYAYYPSAVEAGVMGFADGIMILHDYVGSIGTSNPGSSRALTHEIGHWLNLQHPWGNTNDPGVVCGDDEVDDTPITKGSDLVCDLDQAICDPNIIENVQNFMDYSYCSRMYTAGQALRMRAALHSNVSNRANLWSASNLAATGTDGITGQICPPIADLYPDRRYICEGSSVNFTDNSTNAEVTSWAWTFQDGTPSTSTDQNPVITFNGNGWKAVSLTVSGPGGTGTTTQAYSVNVSAYPDVVGLLSQPFDQANPWSWENPEGNVTTWQHITTDGHYSDGCMRLNNSDSYMDVNFLGDNGGDVDELISPVLDMTYITDPVLSFWTKYATQTTNLADATEELKVYSSTNCGRTWTLRATYDILDLLLNQGSGSWIEHQLTLPSSLTEPQVRLKFQFTASAASDDLFIDDINILGTVGLQEANSAPAMRLEPNPAAEAFKLFFAAEGDVDVRIHASDGRLVWQMDRSDATNGVRLQLTKSELGGASGLFLVQVSNARGTTSRRLIIE